MYSQAPLKLHIDKDKSPQSENICMKYLQEFAENTIEYLVVVKKHMYEIFTRMCRKTS